MRDTAIRNTHPSVVTINGETGAFDQDGNSVTIDQSLVDAEVTRLQSEYDSQEYARDRAIAYPSLQDQADMQYWDAVNGTTTWQDAIAKVKADYPKG